MKVLVIQSYISKREREEEVRAKLVKELHNGTGVVMIPNGFNLADVVEDPVDICFADLSSGNDFKKTNPLLVYYEIWNDVSEMKSECTEMCTTLEIAKDHLKNNHADWCRPQGTGRIYEVTLTVSDDGSIKKSTREVFRSDIL